MKTQSNDARRRALVTKIQTEGAEAAYQAALAVCLDIKAPAPARATCATTLLRAGGYLNVRPVDAEDREGHEMSGAELSAAIAALEALQSLRESGGEADDPGEDLGLFG